VTNPLPGARAGPRSRLRQNAAIGALVVGVVLFVALGFRMVIAPFPSDRLIEWQVRGFNGRGIDATTAETATVIPVFIASWRVDGDSWLGAPVVTYTPWAVIITMHTRVSGGCSGICGWYDTGGWVNVLLSEPLGGRALQDGSKFPPEARRYR
jgi:hypothetical protein